MWTGTAWPAEGDGAQFRGDKGDTGDTGPQGPQGNAATISVGSTTTLPVGYNATVENVGSIYNAVLNFGIPQGPQGEQGPAGADGFDPIATVTQDAGGATISITDANGTTTAYISNGAGANVPIATTSIPGKVMPDGSTITVAADGTIAAAQPTVNDGTLTIQQNGTTAGTFTANSSTNTTIALTDTTYSAFTGTDGQTAGTAGLVPAPATTDAGKFLKADGTWDTAGSAANNISSADWSALWQ